MGDDVTHDSRPQRVAFLVTSERVNLHLAYAHILHHASIEQSYGSPTALAFEMCFFGGGWFAAFLAWRYYGLESATQIIATMIVASVAMGYQHAYRFRGRWPWFSKSALRIRALIPVTSRDASFLLELMRKRTARIRSFSLVSAIALLAIFGIVFLTDGATQLLVIFLFFALLIGSNYIANLLSWLGAFEVSGNRVSLWQAKRIMSVAAVDHLEGILLLAVLMFVGEFAILLMQFIGAGTQHDLDWARNGISYVGCFLILVQASQVYLGFLIPLARLERPKECFGWCGIIIVVALLPFFSHSVLTILVMAALIMGGWAFTIGLNSGSCRRELLLAASSSAIAAILAALVSESFALCGIGTVSITGVVLATLLTITTEAAIAWTATASSNLCVDGEQGLPPAIVALAHAELERRKVTRPVHRAVLRFAILTAAILCTGVVLGEHFAKQTCVLYECSFAQNDRQGVPERVIPTTCPDSGRNVLALHTSNYRGILFESPVLRPDSDSVYELNMPLNTKSFTAECTVDIEFCPVGATAVSIGHITLAHISAAKQGWQEISVSFLAPPKTCSAVLRLRCDSEGTGEVLLAPVKISKRLSGQTGSEVLRLEQ